MLKETKKKIIGKEIEKLKKCWDNPPLTKAREIDLRDFGNSIINQILELFAQQKQKWVKDLKQGKICLNCGGKKASNLTDLCEKCLEEN